MLSHEKGTDLGFRVVSPNHVLGNIDTDTFASIQADGLKEVNKNTIIGCMGNALATAYPCHRRSPAYARQTSYR